MPLCPNPEELQAFTLGALAAERLEQIGEHLDHCLACQQQLGEISAEDSLVESLRKPLGPQAPAAPQEHREALRSRGYELLQLLGQGGMGAVYLARHAPLNRLAAVKLLPADRLGDALAVARFQREIRALAALDSPHIVRATDGGQALRWHFLAMEYVIGVNAGELSARLGPLPVPAACEIVRQAALGIDHAARMGFVHRDIKPSNLMVSEQGLVKVLDFGLAAILERDDTGELTSTGQVMGTLEYMAPEQLSDTRGVDHRADLYSLGCTLYKLLAGAGPFSGTRFRHPVRQIEGHTHLPHEPLRLRRPDVPPEVAGVVDRLLVKDPGGRFATGAEVARVLEPWCRGADLISLVGRARVMSNPLSATFEMPSDRSLAATQSISPRPVQAQIALPPAARDDTHRKALIIVGIVVACFFVVAVMGFGTSYAVTRGLASLVRKPPPPAQKAPAPQRVEPEPEPAPRIEKPAEQPAEKPVRKIGKRPPPAADPPEELRPKLPEPPPGEAPRRGLQELLPRIQPKPIEPATRVADLAPKMEAKAAMPPEPMLVDSEIAFRTSYRNQLLETETVEQKLALVERLLRLAESTVGDPPSRCVVLRVARRLAEDAGSPRATFEVLAMLDRYFEVDLLALQKDSLQKLRGSEHADPAELAEAMLAVAALAIRREDFALSSELAPAALVTARKSQDAAAIRKATQWASEAARAREEHAQAQAARETLLKNPADPRANYAAGKYAIIFMGRWDDGLPMLARGEQEEWRAAAVMDLSQPKAPSEQLHLADLWWQLSEQPGVIARERLRDRAAVWYGNALPKLSGEDKARARGRLDETPFGRVLLAQVNPAPQPTPAETKQTGQPARPGEPPRREAAKLPEGATWLADLQPKTEGIHGGDQVKRSVSLAGTEHAHALWGQPTQDQGTARISFTLGGQYTQLQGRCGMTDQTSTFNPGDPMTPGAVFEIYGDNKLLWTSKPLVGRGATQEFDLRLRNVRNLVLVTKSNTYSYLSSCAWGNLILQR